MNLRTMIPALLSISIVFLFGLGCNFAQMKDTKNQTNDSKKSAKTKKSKDTMETEEKTLIGRWKSDIATVEIKENGKMTINGQLFNYRVFDATKESVKQIIYSRSLRLCHSLHCCQQYHAVKK